MYDIVITHKQTQHQPPPNDMNQDERLFSTQKGDVVTPQVATDVNASKTCFPLSKPGFRRTSSPPSPCTDRFHDCVPAPASPPLRPGFCGNKMLDPTSLASEANTKQNTQSSVPYWPPAPRPFRCAGETEAQSAPPALGWYFQDHFVDAYFATNSSGTCSAIQNGN